jgi:hypothetical protein
LRSSDLKGKVHGDFSWDSDGIRRNLWDFKMLMVVQGTSWDSDGVLMGTSWDFRGLNLGILSGIY